MAQLSAEDINWDNGTVGYHRKKTRKAALVNFGADATAMLRSLPQFGPLCPNLFPRRDAHRATEFKQVCRRRSFRCWNKPRQSSPNESTTPVHEHLTKLCNYPQSTLPVLPPHGPDHLGDLWTHMINITPNHESHGYYHFEIGPQLGVDSWLLGGPQVWSSRASGFPCSTPRRSVHRCQRQRFPKLLIRGRRSWRN